MDEEGAGLVSSDEKYGHLNSILKPCCVYVTKNLVELISSRAVKQFKLHLTALFF